MVSCRKMADRIDVLFGMKTHVDPKNCVLLGAQIPAGEAAIFWG